MNIILEKKEEERIISIIKYTNDEAELETSKLIKLIKDLILEKNNYKEDYWNWKVLSYIEQTTQAIQLSDSGISIGSVLPVFVRNNDEHLTYKIKNKEYLIRMLEYVEDKENDTFGKISKYIIGKNKEKWVCHNCNRYLGKNLITPTYEEFYELLTNFSIEKYWKCRSCHRNNWFEIDQEGHILFYSD